MVSFHHLIVLYLITVHQGGALSILRSSELLQFPAEMICGTRRQLCFYLSHSFNLSCIVKKTCSNSLKPDQLSNINKISVDIPSTNNVFKPIAIHKRLQMGSLTFTDI